MPGPVCWSGAGVEPAAMGETIPQAITVLIMTPAEKIWHKRDSQRSGGRPPAPAYPTDARLGEDLPHGTRIPGRATAPCDARAGPGQQDGILLPTAGGVARLRRGRRQRA